MSSVEKMTDLVREQVCFLILRESPPSVSGGRKRRASAGRSPGSPDADGTGLLWAPAGPGLAFSSDSQSQRHLILSAM